MQDISHIFMILFLMLGPFKIIGPFNKMTKGADPALVRQFALRGILLSSMSLLLAALIGENIISNYGIPIPILSMSGGLILFLVAILNVIRQFGDYATHEANPEPLNLNMAMYPLAFPTIVTPYGIAAVIVFMSLMPDTKSRLVVGAIVLGIMVLNLLMMLLNKYIFKYMAIILPVLGAILSVVQVALGLQIIYRTFTQLMKQP
jgi:multiple antibiotic resistance protein